jgi:BirA family biotin operon repressor/biotin-[acetyl-CoA-carboxylase] ligase
MIDRVRFAEHLRTRAWGRVLVSVPQSGSTQDMAADAWMNGAGDGAVFQADVQSHGVGRTERVWQSPPGGLWFSVLCVVPSSDLPRWTTWPLAVAVAVAGAVQAFGVDAQIKWPNDLLANGRKLAGIVAKLGPERPGETAIVTGIGINVANELPELPPPALSPTNLAEAHGSTTDLSVVLASCCNHLEVAVDTLRNHDSGAIMDTYRRLCGTIGQRVTISHPSGLLAGTVIDVEDTGALLLEEASGARREIWAGDVHSVRSER